MDEVRRRKDEWLEKFQGAVLRADTGLGSPMLCHMFTRTFDHVGRNAYFITVFGTVLLGENEAREPEDHVNRRMDEVSQAFQRKIDAARIAIADAGISDCATFRLSGQQAIIISPVQTRYLKLLQKAEELLCLVHTLWLNGEITNKEKSKSELEIKLLVRTIAGATRKMRIRMQARVNERNARPAAAGARPAPDASGSGGTTGEDSDPAVARNEPEPGGEMLALAAA